MLCTRNILITIVTMRLIMKRRAKIEQENVNNRKLEQHYEYQIKRNLRPNELYIREIFVSFYSNNQIART